jgi:lipopolysaccharide export LptBFGC system permease protein LptF
MKTVSLETFIPPEVALYFPNFLMVVVSYFLMKRVIRL